MDVPGPQRVSPDESHIAHWLAGSEITDIGQSDGQVSHHSSLDVLKGDLRSLLRVLDRLGGQTPELDVS
jgi:hypothetical protein